MLSFFVFFIHYTIRSLHGRPTVLVESSLLATRAYEKFPFKMQYFLY